MSHSLWRKFWREVGEALVVIVLMHVMSDKPLSVTKLLRSTLLMAMVTTFLETYDKKIHDSVKQGITATAGGSLLPKPHVST